MPKGGRTVAIVGAYEHPTRLVPDKSDFQFFYECVNGAINDAGLTRDDVDGLCTQTTEIEGGDILDPAANSLTDYLNLHPKFVDSTNVGGASLQFQIRRAALAIEAGIASCIVVGFAIRPHSRRVAVGTTGTSIRRAELNPTAESFEDMYGLTTVAFFAMTTNRHMHLYGTTDEHLAQVAVAQRTWATMNPQAKYRDPITVDDVLNSRMICSPLHLLNVCMISDGGGAIVLASPEVTRRAKKKPIWILSDEEAFSHNDGGYGDWLELGTREASPKAFAAAGVTHDDIDTVQIYDATSFHPIFHLENLGFCKIGEGGPFLDGGRTISPGGSLPTNTDGGGLSSNQPGTRGLLQVIEAVRQLRGECDERQVPDCKLAVASAVGGGGEGGLASRRSASVMLLARD